MSRRFGIAAAIFVFAGALVWAPGSARGDTVVLRNGRKFTNVKTRLTKGRIIITDKRGRVRRYRARDIKLMLPGKVDWTVPARKPPRKKPVRRPPPRKVVKPPVKKVVKKEPVRKAPVRKEPLRAAPAKKTPPKVAVKNPVLPRGTNDSRYSSKWSRAGQSLIPFWSGFYNGGRNNYGYLFTGLELYAAAVLFPWIARPRPYEQEILPLIQVAGRPPPPPGGGPPPPGGPPPDRTAEIYGQIGQLGLSVHPRTGGIIRRADYEARRNQLAAGLAAVIITHVVLAYFIDPPPTSSPSSGTAHTVPSSGGSGSEGDASGFIFALDAGLGDPREGEPENRGIKLGYSLRF